MNKHNQKDVNN